MASFGAMIGAGEGSTFLGLPLCRDLSRMQAAMALIGAEGCTPYPGAGFFCAGGPAAIRAASADYAAHLGHLNFDLGGPIFPEGVAAVDAGDLPQVLDDAPGNRARIFGAVSQVLDRGAVPLLIGGDDSLPIPMIEAFGARDRMFHILQIDAHIDWRDERFGERLGLSSSMRRASEMAHVAGMVQVGCRGIGSAREQELQDALDWGVEFVPSGEVVRAGVARAVDLIPEGAEVIICLDLDALDPSVMPAVAGRTAGGLSYWQVLELVAGVAEKARIAGFGMMEFMPERDIDGLGAGMAAQLLASVMGIVARQG